MKFGLNRRALVAGTALAGSLMFAHGAFAQSTGTETAEDTTTVDTLMVRAGPVTTGGTILKETVAKSRSTITQEFIETQSAGQSVLQDINLLPGVNYTNNDPYGSSGGNIRIRSFDGPRISLTWDGMPLNDSGNYAIFGSQLMDGELIGRAQVNLGTTDVDSPTASATGGTVSYASRKPGSEFGGFVVGSLGSFNYRRVLGMIDTGEIMGTGITSWLAASHQTNDKFKGPGEINKTQYNARFYKTFGDMGDFVSAAFHYNKARNNFYRNPTLAQYQAQGNAFENFATCTRDAPTAGVADNEGSNTLAGGAENPLNPGACTNYYNVRVNPSDTGNFRGQARFHINENLIVTVDPSFQYVMANGGGSTTLSESGTSALTRQLLGNAFERPTPVTAFDLNGDGDTLDTIRYYTPNNTNTHRIGLTSSLIWDVSANHRIRFAYTFDRADHRQTGEWSPLDANGDPLKPFSAHFDRDLRVVGPDGSFMRQRDRQSIAMLNQIAADYNGSTMDDRIRINAGVRLPFFKRDLQNNCFTNTAGFGYCTTSSIATTNADGSVFLVGQPTTRYIAPFKAVKKYDKVLPNIGLSFQVAEGQSIYVSYAEGLSAPRTDNLYNFSIPNVQPETTKAYDLGYRYQKGSILASAALWKVLYHNRIVSAFDQDLGINIDRNVGEVDIYGLDTELGWRPNDNVSLYASASYNHSEIGGDYRISSTQILHTSGKRLVETPEWTIGGRAQYRNEYFSAGLQTKYVGDRFSTDINDEIAKSYTVWDFDFRLKLDRWGFKGSYAQFNITNLFDEKYLGSISSRNNALLIPATTDSVAIAGSAPTYSVGAPRAYQFSLRAAF